MKSEETVHDPGFITNAVGNPYKVAQPAGLRTFDKDPYLKGGHEVPFRMAKVVTYKRGIEDADGHKYIEEGVEKRKPIKNEDGDVPTGPRNFYTKNLRAGRTATSLVFGDRTVGFYEYKEDDYNIQKKMMGTELKGH